MSRYKLTFAKRGYMIFTSHLDMQRLFKRAFKRAGIALAYSQGYNPHPLMSFAQPLSLGYYSESEILEFKTTENHSGKYIAEKLPEVMPEGLVILGCERMSDTEKTIASRCYAADYRILIDFRGDKAAAKRAAGSIGGYLDQDEIVVLKKTKKKKEPVPVDIKNKIRSIDLDLADDIIIMKTKLDAGSDSNLSPELVLKSFFAYNNIELHRENIDISRLQILYQ